MSVTVQVIPVSQIRANEVSLRTVQTESEAFLGIVESIKINGILNAISVRHRTDEETGEEYFEVIDGLHRYTAAKVAGLTEMPAIIKDLSTDEVHEAQIMANVHRVETKPAQYTKMLVGLLNRNPMMTITELANKLGKSVTWVSKRLSLTKITDEKIQDLIDADEIPLSNAFALAKLPEDDQRLFLEDAMVLSPKEFLPKVDARIKEIREANRKGKDAAPREFQPTAFLRKMKEVKEELESKNLAPQLAEGLSPVDAFLEGLRFCIHLDRISVEEQRAKDEARKAERDAAKKKREAERLAKKREKALKAQEEAEKAAEEAGLSLTDEAVAMDATA